MNFRNKLFLPIIIKKSSLVWKLVHYDRKKFYNIGPGLIPNKERFFPQNYKIYQQHWFLQSLNLSKKNIFMLKLDLIY